MSILIWEKICSAIRNSAPSESASIKIASCTLNLIKNAAVRSDLELIATFHSWFWFPHFKFLQEGDPAVGGTASFLARHITVRYFLMMDDLRIIDTGESKAHDSFRDYNKSVVALCAEDQVIAEKKFKYFFRYVRESFLKHFVIRLDELFFLSLFSCHQNSTCFAITPSCSTIDFRWCWYMAGESAQSLTYWLPPTIFRTVLSISDKYSICGKGCKIIWLCSTWSSRWEE